MSFRSFHSPAIVSGEPSRKRDNCSGMVLLDSPVHLRLFRMARGAFARHILLHASIFLFARPDLGAHSASEDVRLGH